MSTTVADLLHNTENMQNFQEDHEVQMWLLNMMKTSVITDDMEVSCYEDETWGGDSVRVIDFLRKDKNGICYSLEVRYDYQFEMYRFEMRGEETEILETLITKNFNEVIDFLNSSVDTA